MIMINKDLGVEIPKNLKLIDADHDPLGLPSDQDITYIFKFDAAAFATLKKNIEHSVLFNIASEKEFAELPSDQKVNIIIKLAENKMTSYWIRSDTGYLYDGNALFINDKDKPCVKAAWKGIYLPNYDSSRGGHAFPVYQVTAVIDNKTATLTYHYVHP